MTPLEEDASTRADKEGERWRYSSVSTERKFHTINGSPMYQPRFDEVMSFHSPGLAPAKLGNDWFHITEDGNRAYEQSFDRVWGYYSGLAAVKENGEFYHIFPDGQPAYKQRYAWVGNFQGGRCAARFINGKYSHILPNGVTAYGNAYRYVGDYKENYAVVELDSGMHIHIDKKGEPLNSKMFVDLGVFHKGVAPAKDETGWFHIDKRGESLYSRRFCSVEPFYNGIARVQNNYGGIEAIDESGEVVSILRENTSTPLQQVSDLMVSYWKSGLVHSAIELGVFDFLPSTTENLSKSLSLTYDNTNRLMRALWEVDLVIPRDGNWEATESGYLMSRESDYNLAAVDSNWFSLGGTAWSRLTESIKTSTPGWEIATGKSFFDHLSANKKDLELYQQAMSVYADHDYEGISSLIDTTGWNDVADAGCGSGTLLFSILVKNERLRGILFDIPEQISRIAVSKDLKKRVSKVGGDLLERWDFKVDAVLLTRVLHDWNDSKAKEILKRAKEAIHGKGRIYIVEWITKKSNPDGSLADLNLLTTCGGHERTFEEWNCLFSSVGLKVHSIKGLPRYGHLMELEIG